MNWNTRSGRCLLAILSGILLWAAWPPSPFFFLLFFAFLPILFIEDSISNDAKPNKGRRIFWTSFLALLIWNVLTTYWIYFATASAGVGPASSAAWILNALFQTLPIWGYHRIKKRYDQRIGFMALISFWLCFEWIHFSWELAWPWLALGNVFAKTPQLVQWYDLVGVSGGSFWVLAINCFLFALWKNWSVKSLTFRYFLLVLLLPIAYSFYRYSTYQSTDSPIEVAIIQPNIDPYSSQRQAAQDKEAIHKMISLTKGAITENTDYVIFPETALPGFTWKRTINENNYLDSLKDVIKAAPNAAVVLGVDLFENYGPVKKTATARYAQYDHFYYDVYNAALEVDPNGEIEIYAKSKLVPGVERMPYPEQLRFLEKLVIDLGGASGSRATQKERSVFIGGKAKVAPAICYESVFGDYMNEFVKKGANVIFILTNDGWWKDTPGYKQHLHYARLRAIENRRSIARSANTGISATINQRGDIMEHTEWWEAASLTTTINLNEKQTLYTRFGDVFYRVAGLMTIILILISLVKRYTADFLYR